MQINSLHQQAKVIGKYNDIIIDAKLENGEEIPVFCSALDIARMCNVGTTIYVRHLRKKSFHISYEVEFIEHQGSLVFARPNANNDLFEEAFNAQMLPEFSNYAYCHRLGQSDHRPHIDFELSNHNGEKCFIFVTNVYNKIGNSAVFPTEVNFFEIEMFEEMQKLRDEGYQTYAFMIIPRSDCQNIRFSWNHSPQAAAQIYEAAKNGLKFIGYGCNIDKKSVTLSHIMPILY